MDAEVPMSNDLPRTPLQTNEEVLEEEIRDLESPSLKSWLVWGVALALLIVAVGVVAVFMRIDKFGAAERQADRLAGLPPMELPLQDPKGILDAPPDAFRWSAVDGALSYVVVVSERDTGEVVVQRPVSTPYLMPTDVESANLVPGQYAWTVEARRSDGSRMARSEAFFQVIEGTLAE
jgi:hypothetical protein